MQMSKDEKADFIVNLEYLKFYIKSGKNEPNQKENALDMIDIMLKTVFSR